eukprot:Filipodium_phascolosomae@DN2805_c3_g1_i25.p1
MASVHTMVPSSSRNTTLEKCVYIGQGLQFLHGTCPKSLNPAWSANNKDHNAKKQFAVTYAEGLPPTPIVVELWDERGIGKDFLGEVLVPFPTESGVMVRHRKPVEDSGNHGARRTQAGPTRCMLTVDVRHC